MIYSGEPRHEEALPAGLSAALRRQIGDEVRGNRSELESLYNDSVGVGGELRYPLLWRLSEMERVCAGLERCAESAVLSAADAACLHTRVADLVLEAAQLRQEARLLLNAYQGKSRPGLRQSKRASWRGERLATYSGRHAAALI